MTRIGFFFLTACLMTAAQAQVQAQVPGELPQRDEVQARGRALQQERDALESQYKQQLKQCYQDFDVTRCRNAAREAYVVQHRALRNRENAQAADARLLDAEAARQRLRDKQNDALDRARAAEQAQQNAAQRATQNTNKQSDHQPDASKRSQFDEKQREAVERRQEVDRRAREREKPRAAPLPSPTGQP